MATPSSNNLNVIDLGRMGYAPAFDQQRQVHADVVAGNASPTLLLVEHDPVITVSRRKAAPQHLIADQATLDRLGVDVQPTDRGGDITYHGPGQLVAYPIVRLNDLGLNVGRYMRLLEQIIIDTLAAFKVTGQRDEAGTGVWVGGKAESGERKAELESQNSPAARGLASPNPEPKKIAAIGVRISRGVSMHGLALNVTADLSHFDLIVPCGLAGRAVTSLQQQLADQTPTMEAVKHAVATAAQHHLTLA